MKAIIIKIHNYLSLITFSHTIFALPFALLAFFIATKIDLYVFDFKTLIFIIFCMIFARNAGMSFNRYVDRFIDAKNLRTAKREIPNNVIKERNALIFCIINSLLFIISTYFINKTCFYLSPLALFIILGYSYTKRFTFLSHFFIGLSLSIAPAGAYIAVTGHLNFPIILLSLIVLFWTAGFDIIYSLQDEEFDRKNNLFSIPAKFSKLKALIISECLHFICAILLIYFSILLNANFIFWIGTAIFILLLIYQHLIVSKDDISKINIAFGTTNGIASIIFVSCAIISFYF